MAQWRHSHRGFGLYRFSGYYPVSDAVCDREQQPPPYHPISVLANRTIFVTSVLAIVAGIAGKGPLETPTFVCSTVCLLILALALLAA